MNLAFLCTSKVKIKNYFALLPPNGPTSKWPDCSKIKKIVLVQTGSCTLLTFRAPLREKTSQL